MKQPRPYALDRNIRWLTRRRDALLKTLRTTGPLVDGSLVLIARTCGNSAHCHCATGEKHVSTYLTYKIKGKTHTLYIPVALEKEARRWSAEHRRLKELASLICEIQRAIIRRYVQERRRRP